MLGQGGRGRDPSRVGDLPGVGANRLTPRCTGREEPGVEPAGLHLGGDPVRDRHEVVGPNREAIRRAVQQRLSNELGPYSIQINDLLIDNIDFRPEFKQAIEQKQIAAQDALREQEKVKQKQFEAEQAVETAKGEANATRERANGQADANRALAASLTPEVIQFQAIQKLGDNIQIALIPSGQGVILDPATLLGGIKP